MEREKKFHQCMAMHFSKGQHVEVRLDRLVRGIGLVGIRFAVRVGSEFACCLTIELPCLRKYCKHLYKGLIYFEVW